MINELNVLRLIRWQRENKASTIRFTVEEIGREYQFFSPDKKSTGLRDYIERLPHQRQGNEYIVTLKDIDKAKTKEYVKLLYKGIFYADNEILSKKVSKEAYVIYKEILQKIRKQIEKSDNTFSKICIGSKQSILRTEKNKEYEKELILYEKSGIERILNVLLDEHQIRVDKKEIIQEIQQRVTRYDSVYGKP
mgnify:CR=1 FL=1|jgi:hypothetical protein